MDRALSNVSRIEVIRALPTFYSGVTKGFTLLLLDPYLKSRHSELLLNFATRECEPLASRLPIVGCPY